MTVAYTGGQSRGGSRGGRRERSGLPYFSREHCSTDPRSTEIIAVKLTENNRDQTQVSIKMNYGGVLYLWNLRTNNPNLETLIKYFGDDEQTWAGKKVMIANVEDEFSGTVWPTVVEKVSSKRER